MTQRSRLNLKHHPMAGMVGAYLAKTGIMNPKAIEQTLPLAIKRRYLVEANKKALARGIEFAQGAK